MSFFDRFRLQKKRQKLKPRYYFEINRRVKLVFRIGGKSEEHQTIIQDVDEDTFSVIAPMRQGKLRAPTINAEVGVSIFEQSGVYRFKAICEKVIDDGILLLVLRKPQAVRRVQRRQYKRRKISLLLRVHILISGQNVLLISQIRNFATETIDVSAAGVSFYSPQAMEEKKECLLLLALPGKGNDIAIKAEILRSDKDLLGKRFLTRASFIQIDDEDRMKVDDFCSRGG